MKKEVVFEEKFKYVSLLSVLLVVLLSRNCLQYDDWRTTGVPGVRHRRAVIGTKKFCLQLSHTIRARHKSCFLRPDTGPCRADIIQWYFDVRQKKCYQFFWGGCQGNGNRFETKHDCFDHCYLNTTNLKRKIPNFCSLPFDYGTCFGGYRRWHYDPLTQSCKLRLYSGCGGNQNNFHSRSECSGSCLRPPNNTLMRSHQVTTCIPFNVEDF